MMYFIGQTNKIHHLKQIVIVSITSQFPLNNPPEFKSCCMHADLQADNIKLEPSGGKAKTFEVAFFLQSDLGLNEKSP